MGGWKLNRRSFLKWSLPIGAGILGILKAALGREGTLLAGAEAPPAGPAQPPPAAGGTPPSSAPPPSFPPMDPGKFLTHFDYGSVSRLPDGRTLRRYELVALDKEVEVAKGVYFPAWTLNGFVPGPTLRAREGDLVRVHFVNRGGLPHTVHFHGFHSAENDGVFEVVQPGGEFTYEFAAEPFGVHLYHCHVMPLKKHIHKGLYGAFIIDPKAGWPPARELLMVMNGFDTDMDGENEFYTVNGVANYYLDHPIRLRVNEPVRVYLVNLLEFDLINSIHTHATFFRYYRTGTKLEPDDYTDTVMLCQGERGIMEFTYKWPGKYLFHAHQSEFAELGWIGMFDVQPEGAAGAV